MFVEVEGKTVSQIEGFVREALLQSEEWLILLVLDTDLQPK